MTFTLETHNDEKFVPLHDRVSFVAAKKKLKNRWVVSFLPGLWPQKTEHRRRGCRKYRPTADNGESPARWPVKVGRQGGITVLFGSSSIKIDGEDLLMMSESEIYGVLEAELQHYLHSL